MSKKNVGGRPLKFKTVDDLNKKIEGYFKSCWTQKLDIYGNPIFLKNKDGKKTKQKVMVQTKPYTINGLAIFLETSRETLLDYQGKDEFSDTIKRAKDIIYAYKEEYLYSGKNPTGAIFDLKNNYPGWKDNFDLTSKGKRLEGNSIVFADFKKR